MGVLWLIWVFFLACMGVNLFGIVPVLNLTYILIVFFCVFIFLFIFHLFVFLVTKKYISFIYLFITWVTAFIVSILGIVCLVFVLMHLLGRFYCFLLFSYIFLTYLSTVTCTSSFEHPFTQTHFTNKFWWCFKGFAKPFFMFWMVF